MLLRISSDPEALCLEVHDAGLGLEASDQDQLSDRGRGLPLMVALVDEVDIKPSPDGTVVRLTLARD